MAPAPLDIPGDEEIESRCRTPARRWYRTSRAARRRAEPHPPRKTWRFLGRPAVAAEINVVEACRMQNLACFPPRLGARQRSPRTPAPCPSWQSRYRNHRLFIHRAFQGPIIIGSGIGSGKIADTSLKFPSGISQARLSRFNSTANRLKVVLPPSSPSGCRISPYVRRSRFRCSRRDDLRRYSCSRGARRPVSAVHVRAARRPLGYLDPGNRQSDEWRRLANSRCPHLAGWSHGAGRSRDPQSARRARRRPAPGRRYRPVHGARAGAPGIREP